MRKGFLIYEEMRKYLVLWPLVISDYATAPFWISLCMRKILFSFLSVWVAKLVGRWVAKLVGRWVAKLVGRWVA
jgi:hypothetical protein